MKTILLNLVLVLSTATGFSQSAFKVTEEPLPYSHWATSYTTDIIGQDENFVIYYWQKFVEEHKGTTYVKSVEAGNTELESEHVQFPLLDNEEVTIYSRFSPNRTESGILMTIWIKQRDGSFFSSKDHKASAKGIKDWLLGFNKKLLELDEKLIHE